MVAGGSLDIRVGQEVNMEELKKTKGVWAIRVREADAGRSAIIGYNKCKPSPSEGVPYCNEQKNTTDEREE